MDKNTIFSPAELQAYEEIKELVTDGRTGVKNPVTIILGGQPGAGKSGIYNLAKMRFSGNIVKLDCDKFRKYHPNADELAKNLDTYGEKTNPFVSAVVDCMAEELSELGYNMIIESPMKSTNTAFWLHEMLTPKGYSVEAHVMATPKEVSWAGVVSRYEEQLANGELARIVPKEFHDYVTDHITDALSEIYKSGKMSNIIVMDRAKTIMYDMSKEPNRNPSEQLDKIINQGHITLSVLSKAANDNLELFTENDIEFANFLKMYGRLFKFPTSVAIEFYSRSKNIDCIATEGQWKNLGYTLKNSASAVEYIDRNNVTHSFYDFTQIANADFFPERWALTQENINDVKDYLKNNYNISDKNPNASIISMILYCTDILNDAHKCMEKLKIDDSEKDAFIKSYVNNFSLIVSGRLEINAVRPFNITPDLTIMKKLNWSNKKLTYLSYVGKTAKDALRIIEKAVEIHNEKRRENNNELRYLEEEENRSKGKSASVGLSNRSTERSAATELDRSNDILRLRGQSGESTMEEGNSDWERGGNSSILEEYSESDEQLDNVGVRVQPGKLHLHTGDEEFRAVDGGRTGGNLRSEMVRDDGEGLRSGTGTPTGSSSATERSEGSGENGENLSGNTGETVRGEQPTSDRQLRSDSTMGENKTVRSGQPSDERNSITAIHSSNTDEIIPENAIHNAFSEFINNHSFSDEQKEFFDRIEKYSVKNTVTENIIGKAFSERPGIVKKCAVRKHPKSKIGMYQAT